MRVINLVIIFFTVFILNFNGNSQCSGSINFNGWIQEGPPTNGNWIVNVAGDSTVQTLNTQPTFLVSPDNYINVKIRGNLFVHPLAGDDDFIGFVFGYESPNVSTTVNECDFYLFDWKQQYQLDGGYLGEAGFSLSKVDTSVDLSNQPAGWPIFWDQENVGNGRVNLGKRVGPSEGWVHGTSYDFELIYTYSRIMIKIDNDTIFNVIGCFEPGRFGFYNYSQPNVIYSNFTYELIYDFIVPPTVTCLGDTSFFTSLSDTCPAALLDTSIISWNWDFGDGNTSASTNGVNYYQNAGVFSVTLIVEDVNGCKDTTQQLVDIKPKPAHFDLPDSLEHCFDNGTLLLDAGTWSAYYWFDNSTGQTTSVSQKGNYGVTVYDSFGCDSYDAIDVVEFCPAVLIVPNVISPNNDQKNDSLRYFKNHIFQFDFSIYNRWGQLMFQTDDLNNAWDGKNMNNGELVSDGVYYWFAKYWDKKNQLFEQKGNVSVFSN